VTASLRPLIVLALAAGCVRPGSPAPAATSEAAPPAASSPGTAEQGPPPGALAPLASEPLVVLPVQALRMTVPGWSNEVGDPKAYLASLDDEIAFTVRERAIRGKWAFPPDLARSARRNPTYAVDPYTIAVDHLRPVERDADKLITEPLAGQLRAFAGLFNARYAFIPVEVRLAPDAAGGGRATIHLVVVDTRSARLTWKGDITGDVARTFSPAIAAGLAGRVVDLFTIPAR
jgi:hypothetical protein